MPIRNPSIQIRYPIFLLMLCMMLSFAVKAQNPAIDYVRNIYKEAKDFAKESEESHGTKTTIEYKRMVPALGSVSTTIDFYGQEIFESDDAATYPWDYNGKRILKYANVVISQGTTKSHLEYLYDPKNQELIFFYKYDPYEMTEERYYYENKQLIWYATRHINPIDVKKAKENIKMDVFIEEEKIELAKIQAKAKAYITMFNELYTFEKIEKSIN